jgi:acyl dehydratase
MKAMTRRTEVMSRTAVRSKANPPRGPRRRCNRLTRPSSNWLYTRPNLEPLSFDDLPLGGEWITRRRTVSEAEIALFAGVAGDLSPLTIEAPRDGARSAPPALVVAMAVGLGSVDVPVASVAEWEWLNWKFPRPVRAGDTIYAHWMLTQKRPPASGAPSSIVVWRVDVHTADGALCAEGEIGAKVNRKAAAPRRQVPEQVAAGPTAPRRRRRRSRTNGATPAPEPPPVAVPPAAAAANPERASGPSRRRRRRRSPTSAAREEAHEPHAVEPPETAPTPATTPSRRGLGGVLRRLRRT